jgi:hypothetical protein
MPQQRLYFEHVNKLLIPYWYVLTFKPGELYWDKPIQFYDAITPFNHVGRDQFNSSLITKRIHLSDFIFNDYNHERFGLNLKTIRRRLELNGVDPYVVQQFILAAPDISEVLSMIPNERRLDLFLI